jgi:ankyrin repeat protein
MDVRFTILGRAALLLLLWTVSLRAAGNDLRLVKAVEQRDKSAVRSLLAAHADVNAAQGDGSTALQWAAHWDDLETAQSLIQAGANVNAANDYGVTALSLACLNRNSAMVATLLKAKANPNAPQWTGETPLMTCARTGNAEAVKLLLDNSADTKAKETERGQTALMWALAGDHPQAAQALIARGADVHARSTAGFTPLMFAAQQGDLASARTLLAAGASVNESTPEYGSVLVVASASGQEEFAIALLDMGADANAADGNGITSLHWAVQYGLSGMMGVRYDPDYRLQPRNMPNLAKALLAHGANPNVRIKKRFSRGPDGAQFSMQNATPFFLAAASADPEMMKILKAGGADPLLANSEKVTPLMAAASAVCTGSCWSRGENRGNAEEERIALEAVRMAVELGSDVNAINETGQTAMHLAAFTGADTIVQFLSDRGAKVEVPDINGETAWSMAAGVSPVLRYRGQYGSHQSTADLLLKLGARPRTREEMDTRSDASKGGGQYATPPTPTQPSPASTKPGAK